MLQTVLAIVFEFNGFLSLKWKPILLDNVFRMSVLTNALMDQLNMIAFGFLIVTVVFSLQVEGHVGNLKKPAKKHSEIMKQLKNNLNIIDLEMQHLKSNQSQLKAYSAQYQIQCSTELQTIADKHKQATTKGSEAISSMYELLNALKQEEQVHIKLTHELEVLSAVLELFQIQYTVLDGDLKLLSGRRLNGTLDRCKEMSIALKDELVKIRSGFARNPLTFVKTNSPEDLARMMLENDLRSKTASNKKLATDLDVLKTEVEEKKKHCLHSKNEQERVLQEAMTFQETSQNSKNLIQKLLDDAVQHSKAIRLELATGRTFVRLLTEKVSKKRIAIKQHKDDVACYKAIEESV